MRDAAAGSVRTGVFATEAFRATIACVVPAPVVGRRLAATRMVARSATCLMTPSLSTHPLSEREIGELEDVLLALPEDRDGLDVSMLDGFLVGVLLQPDPVMPSEWLPLVFDAPDGEPMIPGDLDRAKRVIELVMRHYNNLAAHIAAREPFDPIVFDVERTDDRPIEPDQELAALWPWAAGFMNALDAFPGLLDRFGDDEDVDVAMLNIVRHIPLDPDDTSDVALDLARQRDEVDRELPLEDLDDAIEQLVLGVMEIADITRPRQPIERAQPKIGRNDPCPCGSGRKYKQCHGRDTSGSEP